MVFFLKKINNIHGLSFHFYLYNVREENTFHFEKSFFVFCYYNFVVQFQMHV
jgi:hypothetical protein